MYVDLPQELQSNQDRGVGLVGMKKLKAYMKDIITTDGEFNAPRLTHPPQLCCLVLNKLFAVAFWSSCSLAAIRAAEMFTHSLFPCRPLQVPSPCQG